ncbi:hypothetical protein [Lysinibacillus sphaericus]|uniref:hypothetical protein n=1 Tax=Lysinibacillus sphaericus TaxID=1421 RepID=UPI003F79A27C
MTLIEVSLYPALTVSKLPIEVNQQTVKARLVQLTISSSLIEVSLYPALTVSKPPPSESTDRKSPIGSTNNQ